MPFASSTAFHDLGAFVLRHHALHLQQQIVFWRLPDVSIEEDNSDAVPLQFIDEQNLISIGPCQTVRRMHIEPVEGTGSSLIAQPFQRRPKQGAATVAFIDKAQFFLETKAVAPDAVLECRHLAGNRVRVGSLLRGNAGVHSNPHRPGDRCG